MKTYEARIFFDDGEPVIISQVRPFLSKAFLKDVELWMECPPYGTHLIRSRIYCEGKEIACIRRDVYQDGERITAFQSLFRIVNGMPQLGCSRFMVIAE